ncbi:ankyrin repeat and KH domain-containing protein 1-like [Salmo trutta]|uniref:ankyrin repeat and KH domain-containing protein 1-like n=1 Tax=Salmo trutta TaxID=8032 RepID=UPI0011322E13|nr:ankyrin repeat and KH domain-containing protein 1-like [Salmo trutta]
MKGEGGAKGGHTIVVSYLLNYSNNILSVPTQDLYQLTHPSHDTSQVAPSRGSALYRITLSLQTVQTDMPPFHPYQPLESIVKETECKLISSHREDPAAE